MKTQKLSVPISFPRRILISTLMVLTSISLVPTLPAWSQLRLIPEAAEQVYAAIPDLPLENTYTPGPTSNVPPQQDTLIRRMMLYHLQEKGRSLTSRLDWKLTFADYLGANEPILAATYPGSQWLTENPLNGDRQAFQTLTRSERNQLLETLLITFGGDPTPPQLYIPPDQPIAQPATTPAPAQTLLLPQPGSADLLKLGS